MDEWYKYESFSVHSYLRCVKIIFKSPLFERITKDRASKFVDIVSSIGGTLGLFTGFCIISIMEITYIMIKSIIRPLRQRFRMDDEHHESLSSVNYFLETSTIAGLSYISKNKDRI